MKTTRRTTKRLLALVLSVCMVLATLPLTGVVTLAASVPTWSGEADISWYIGHEGDESYNIADGEDLAGLMALVNGDTSVPGVTKSYDFRDKTLNLTQSISLGNKRWRGIGDYPDYITNYHSFSGTFDGLGNTIYDLKNDGNDVGGVFGTTSLATIRNLTIENSNLNSGYSNGAVAGETHFTLIENCTAKNTSFDARTQVAVGGLVGKLMEESTIKNCRSEGVRLITDGSGEVDTGGLVGLVSDSTVEGCTASGNVQASMVAGGLIGRASGATVRNCSAAVNVYAASAIEDDHFYGEWYLSGAGGLVGMTNLSTLVDQCSATGNVRVSLLHANAGGLIGWNAAQTARSYATGSVTSTRSNANLGGLVGLNGWGNGTYPNQYSKGEVAECYATGAIDGTQCAQVNAGGLVGQNENLIQHCYATGSIQAGNGSRPEVRAGGLVGEQRPHVYEGGEYNLAVTDNCYATGDVFVKKLGLGTSGRACGIAASYEKGAIRNCVALSRSVEIDGNSLLSGSNPGSYDDQSRIGSRTASLSNNYARADMLVDGKSQAGDSSSSGKQGENIFFNASQEWTKWFSNTEVWDMTYSGLKLVYGTPLPTLKNTGGNQNPIFPYPTDPVSGSDYYWYNPSETNFYLETFAQLKGLADLVNGNTKFGYVSFEGKNVNLSSNVYYSLRGYENWEPIGKDADHAFQGTLRYGNIVGLTCEVNSGGPAGLVGYLGKNGGVLRDITISHANVKGNGNIGLLVGESAYELIDCSVTGNVERTGNSSNNGTGGLVGRNTGVVERCSSAGTVAESSANYGGGLVGVTTGSSAVVRNSSSSAIVSNPNASGYALGGLIGLQEGGTVDNCTARGSVTNSSSGQSLPMTGGLIGQSMSSVTNSYSSGTVTSQNGEAGGLIGTVTGGGSVKGCASTSQVRILNNNASYGIGGLIGRSTGSVQDCYALGNVTADQTAKAGGLIGVNNGTAARCFATGRVENQGTTGGLVSTNSGTIDHSVAMNQMLSSGGMDTAGAIAGSNSATVSNCYARGDMMINNAAQPAVGGENGSFIPCGSTLDWQTYFGTLDEASWQLPGSSQVLAYRRVYLPYLSGKPAPSVELILREEVTATNKHMIRGEEELVYLRELVNHGWDFSGKTVALNEWLTLPDGNWTPIGVSDDSGEHVFNGTFDGGGYTINNLQVDTDGYAGLFGIIGEYGRVENLGLNGVSVSGGDYTGGIAGLTRGTIQKCYVNGSVSGRNYTGGIVGMQGNMEIINCYSTANVSGAEYVGGIVGSNSGYVHNTYASGSVTGENNVGGIVGAAENAGTVAQNIALNPWISATAENGFAARVGKGVQVNYARGDMRINGHPLEQPQETADGQTLEPNRPVSLENCFNRSLMGDNWFQTSFDLTPGERLPWLWMKEVQNPILPSVSVETPVFSKAGGTYNGPQTVEITCATEGAAIFYTTDGTDPAESDTRIEYSEPILLERAATLKACAVKEGMGASATASADYRIRYMLTLTMNSSSSQTTYHLPGELIDLEIAIIIPGYQFEKWELVSGEGEIDDPNQSNALFIMGETDAHLNAVFRDVTAPTGAVTIADNSWYDFLNNVTFGLFFKETQQVAITAQDNSGEDPEIDYLLSEDVLTPEEAKAADGWQSYTGEFSVDPDARFVVYVRIVDAAGNETFLSSDGVVLDATAPEISGAQDGETYTQPVQLTVTDPNLDTVLVNDGEQPVNGDTSSFTLDQNGEYTVTARDKAGNETTLTLTVALAEITGVEVSPKTAEVNRGASRQFEAHVSGTGSFNQEVTWSVEGNQSDATLITQDGLLTVGEDESAQTLTVRAVSQSNERFSDTAEVTVTEPGKVDKSILQRVVTRAEELHDSEEFDNAIWTVQQSFESVLEQAQSVNQDDNATQKQVDEAWVAMMFEIHKLGLTQGNKDLLKEHIELYSSLNMDEYVDNQAKEDFLKALEAAYLMLDNNDAVQSEVDACDDALVAAAQLLVKLLDKETLQSIVDMTLDYKQENYAKGWEEFAAARSAAQELLASEDVTQEQLDLAADRLIGAMTELRFKADKDLLNSLIALAESLDVSGYSAEQLQLFASALDEARRLAEDDSLSRDEQPEINAAAENLKAVIEQMTGETIALTGDSSGTTNSAKTGDVAVPTSALLLGIAAAFILFIKKKKHV